MIQERKFTLEEALQELRKPENRVDDKVFIVAWSKVYDNLGGEEDDYRDLLNEIAVYETEKSNLPEEVKRLYYNFFDIELKKQNTIQRVLRETKREGISSGSSGLSLDLYERITKPISEESKKQSQRVYFEYLRNLGFNEYIKNLVIAEGEGVIEKKLQDKKSYADARQEFIRGFANYSLKGFEEYIMHTRGVDKANAQFLITSDMAKDFGRMIDPLVVNAEKVSLEKARLYSHCLSNGLMGHGCIARNLIKLLSRENYYMAKELVAEIFDKIAEEKGWEGEGKTK